MQLSDQFPDPARTDAGLVLSGEWVTGGTDRLRSTADAMIAAWAGRPWPAGLLSYSLYLDADGDLLRDYAQWTNAGGSRIDATVPGVVRRDEIAYRLYRGSRSAGGAAPGAMVAVRVDTENGVVARTWVDAVFTALAQDTKLPSGGLAAFFHVSTDGRRVLNYAEWVSPQAHREAVSATGRGIAQGPLWDKIQNMPGVRPQSVTRYQLYQTLTER